MGWAVPRVLVVDDDADVRELLRDAFVEAGYAVDLAEDGKAALALLARGCPDAACRRCRRRAAVIPPQVPPGRRALRARRRGCAR